MAIPIPLFTLSYSGDKKLKFTNQTLGAISHQWSFTKNGDSTPEQVSATYSPEITFASYGIYNLILSETNAEGTGQKTIQIVVTQFPSLNLTIISMIKGDLPTGFVVDPLLLDQDIKKWQLYLQPEMVPVIADSDVFIETAWPTLANVMIAKLVVYEIILRGASQAVTATSNNSGKGGLKKLETGPSNAEWYDGSVFWSSIFKGGPDSVIGQLLGEICLYANRLKITLPFCPKRRRTIIFSITHPNSSCCGCHNHVISKGWPWIL